MQQHPINERISFLLKSFNLSARAFSEAIGEKPTITQNYVGARNSMPGADYLEKILKHFDSINPAWLLAGNGEPFKGDAPTHSSTITAHKNKGNIQSNAGSNNTITNFTIDDCRRDLATAEKEIQHLRDQLKMQDALIAAKDETISLLRASYNRPN